MASEMKTPLTVQGLWKNYPAFQLEDVSFSLVPGTITGFIGRNGAGKTTTINSMLSFVRPDAGEISFFGLDYPEHDREIKEKMIDELGDVLWYVSETATALGIWMDQIAEHNIEKLKKRYPGGFSAERSLHREE